MDTSDARENKMNNFTPVFFYTSTKMYVYVVHSSVFLGRVYNSDFVIGLLNSVLLLTF